MVVVPLLLTFLLALCKTYINARSNRMQNPAITVYVPPTFIAFIILSKTPAPNAANQHLIKLRQLVDPLPLLGYKSTNMVVQIPIKTDAENDTRIVDIIVDIICRLN